MYELPWDVWASNNLWQLNLFQPMCILESEPRSSCLEASILHTEPSPGLYVFSLDPNKNYMK